MATRSRANYGPNNNNSNDLSSVLEMLTNLTTKIDQMDNGLQHLEDQPRVVERTNSRPSSEPTFREPFEDMPRNHAFRNQYRRTTPQ